MSFPVGSTMYPWLRNRLWAIHRDTGGGLPQEELAALYGGTRATVVERVLPIIEEVVRGLQGSPAMNATRRAALGAWNRATHALIAIVRNDQQAPDNRRRR